MVFKIFNLTLLIYSGVEVRFESASQQIVVFVRVSIACIAHDYFRLSHQQIIVVYCFFQKRRVVFSYPAILHRLLNLREKETKWETKLVHQRKTLD